MKQVNAHQFALWQAELSDEHLIKGQEHNITCKNLITRLKSVLRLRISETFILFDRRYNAQLSIVAIHDKRITTVVLCITNNRIYAPTITALLPLLKKDDLSTAVADLTAVGVSAIQLVLTDTIHRSWGGDQEYARLERVMIAAAEQSKNFTVPELHNPCSLLNALSHHSTIICGDPEGDTFRSVFCNVSGSSSVHYAVLVGPESDFTIVEKRVLKEAGVINCALTPTVLRSHLAITIMAASVRSWYHGP